MEKKKYIKKEHVESGVSSMAGSVVGVVAGNVIAQTASAGEVGAPEEIAVEEVTPVLAEEAATGSAPVPEQPVEVQTGEPEVVSPAVTASQHEPQVEVLGYETVSVDGGGQMDVAVVSVGGEQVVIADVDQDGTADLMAADLNHNGVIDAGEIVDISGEDLAMQSLQEQVQDPMAGGDPNLYLADADTPDYVNDANVDDFQA